MSSMRWGDPDSSDDDEVPYVPAGQAAAQSSNFNDRDVAVNEISSHVHSDERGMDKSAKIGGGRVGGSGGNRSGLFGAKDNHALPKSPPRPKHKEHDQNLGRHHGGETKGKAGGGASHGKGGGKNSRGGNDWKQMAKSASRFSGPALKEPVDGSSWMAQRRAKLEQEENEHKKRAEEQKLKQQEEKRERRKSQLDALKEAMKVIKTTEPPPSTSLQRAVAKSPIRGGRDGRETNEFDHAAGKKKGRDKGHQKDSNGVGSSGAHGEESHHGGGGGKKDARKSQVKILARDEAKQSKQSGESKKNKSEDGSDDLGSKTEDGQQSKKNGRPNKHDKKKANHVKGGRGGEGKKGKSSAPPQHVTVENNTSTKYQETKEGEPAASVHVSPSEQESGANDDGSERSRGSWQEVQKPPRRRSSLLRQSDVDDRSVTSVHSQGRGGGRGRGRGRGKHGRGHKKGGRGNNTHSSTDAGDNKPNDIDSGTSEIKNDRHPSHHGGRGRGRGRGRHGRGDKANNTGNEQTGEAPDKSKKDGNNVSRGGGRGHGRGRGRHGGRGGGRSPIVQRIEIGKD